MTTLIQRIASTIGALANCAKSGNTEWRQKHAETLLRIERNDLPSGSGIDSGTKIDLDRSSADRVVLTCSYHHHAEHGYDGWTEHTVTVRPAFSGLDIRISGRNRNEIKDYLHDVFLECLRAEVKP